MSAAHVVTVVLNSSQPDSD